MCAAVFLRFYQGRNIKILGRNNLSECPHKYLMCSISQGLQCKCACVCACVHVCVDCNYLTAAKEGRGESERMKERAERGREKRQNAQKNIITINYIVEGVL